MTFAPSSALNGVLASIPSPSVSYIDLGPLRIHFYALCILSGIAVAMWWATKRWEKRGGDGDTLFDIIFVAIIAFLPLIILIFLNKDMDKGQKATAGVVGIVLAVIAAVIALGSFYVFGVNRRVEPLLGSEDGASKAETGTEEPSEPGAEEPSEPGAEESSVTGAEEPSTDSSSDESATTPTSRTQQTDSAAT